MTSKRHKAREMAVQMLYQRDLGGSSLEEILEAFRSSAGAEEADEADEEESEAVPDEELPAVVEHATRLVGGTVEHLEEIDGLIAAQADNWRLERMPAVDRNILRLGVYEFLYEPDVPKLVVIDEAIELAKHYGSENSSSFVNGLLDGLVKQHSFPGSLT